MKIEQEDLSIQLSEENEKYLIGDLISSFDRYNDDRSIQLTEIEAVKNAVYSQQPLKNNWNTKIELPDIYELAQTLKSHLSENLFSHPEAMFDISGTSPDTQSCANKQKSMLIDVFEKMNIENEIEKVIDSIVMTGETTLFVGWETRLKQIRRAKTFQEELLNPTASKFILEEKVVYDNPRVKFIKSQDFVFDKSSIDEWDSCAKFYRSYQTIDSIVSDKANNMLTPDKLETLKGVVASKKHKSEDDKSTKGSKLEILEYWGDIELKDGTLLKNRLIVLAGRREIIRFEANPFVINPFIHANIIENPHTKRGISPLKVALSLNDISSTILNKQLDALALMINPPYLAPKGCFRGEQEVKPGKIIEYDSALMPNAPIPLNFDKAMVGWDFLTYFKNNIESATGIFKNMAGNLQSVQRTATELNYSATGQEARLNMLLDSINRKIIIPMVEKTAEILANFKFGKETVAMRSNDGISFVEIDDNVRCADYVYRYGDRKATLTRKLMMRELFEIIQSFAQVPEVAERVDWLECFKYVLEQYGIENSSNFLKNELPDLTNAGNNVNVMQ
ncbi:hypothetical protein J6E39_01655 [bacterium]|nr:hypothetical protein [bacterium]